MNSLMVNVNVCYTAFYKEQNLAQAMVEFAAASYGGLVDKFVEGVRVSPTHVSRLDFLRFCSHMAIFPRILQLTYHPKKTVRRVSRQSADQVRFQCQELGGMVTVLQYFQKSGLVFSFIRLC